MAEIDGAWECVAATPMGEQRFTMDVTRTGDRFTARNSGALGTIEVTDGRIDGDALNWTMELTLPFPVSIKGAAKVAGDRLDGSITAGVLGTFPLRGTKS